MAAEINPAPHAAPADQAILAEARMPSAPWLFGKLPAHGDFVARGLGGALRDKFDGWLAAELARARQRFGDGFDQLYLSAPPWHFVDRDPAGAWTGGALCASVDAVGRRFPILLAAPAGTPEAALAAARIAVDLGCAAIAQSWDASRLHQELAAIRPGVDAGAEVRTGWAIEGDDGTTLTYAGRFPTGLVERMLEIAP